MNWSITCKFYRREQIIPNILSRTNKHVQCLLKSAANPLCLPVTLRVESKRHTHLSFAESHDCLLEEARKLGVSFKHDIL